MIYALVIVLYFINGEVIIVNKKTPYNSFEECAIASEPYVTADPVDEAEVLGVFCIELSETINL